MMPDADQKPSSRPRLRWLFPLAASLVSGFLLWSAFPPMSEAESAWVALIPLLIMARFASVRSAFGWGWLTGMVAWVPGVWWILLLGKGGAPWVGVVFGWLILAAYCALYSGLFAVGARWIYRCSDKEVPLVGRSVAGCAGNFGAVLVIPLLWIGLEYIRSRFATGFSWNQLGVSQYRNIAVIQIAEYGGVYAVSAVLVLVNAALAQVVVNIFRPRPRLRKWRLQWEFAFVLVVCFGLWWFGANRSEQFRSAYPQRIRISAIQPNIPQYEKWQDDEAAVRRTYLPLLRYTRMASALAPDLVVWPETAVPDWMPYSRRLNHVIAAACTGRIDELPEQFLPDFTPAGMANPVNILFGAMEWRNKHSAYNSVFLFSDEGRHLGAYRKRHLVPFGEYVPMRSVLGFLDFFAPMGFPCVPGTGPGVLQLPLRSRVEQLPDGYSDPVGLGVLICFEDTFGYLARDAVKAGAQVLINPTNDGWFDGSAAAMQHMTHSVFRSVENRISTVRCANSGVTCAIDPSGRIDALSLKFQENKQIRGEMYRTFDVAVRCSTAPLTFYARYGDWPFAIPCAFITLLCFSAAVVMFGRRQLKGGYGSFVRWRHPLRQKGK